jgi:DNA-binding beta-propeller fold protein YncE
MDGTRKQFRGIKNTAALAAIVMGTAWTAAAQTPQATELPGAVYSITNKWTIGGEGNWDYLTLDPTAMQLYIAHGPVVQVVDVAGGTKSGEVKGLKDAHSVALDDNSQFGFVTDGPANAVRVFDRRTFEVVATIPTEKNPRALVYEPVSRLIFAICPDTTATTSGQSKSTATGSGPRSDGMQSTISIIDPDTQKPVADLIVPGKLGFAQADGKGRVYLAVTDRNEVAYFNAQSLQTRMRQAAQDAADGNAAGGSGSGAQSGPQSGPQSAGVANGATTSTVTASSVTPKINWALPPPATSDGNPPSRPWHVFHLQDCQNPKGLALDSANERVFTACDNMKMQVLSSTNGQIIATLPIGAGTDAIGYDAKHGLIYTSNGGGVGSLTIIKQHLTDSYAVIQEMPTQARARTLAIDPDSGHVYLVTNVMGFDLTHPGGVGDLKSQAVQGSFQVLVVGN